MHQPTIKLLSFDCFGTLIDWESGILSAVRPLINEYNIEVSDAGILSAFAKAESIAQSKTYRPYKEILVDVMRQLGAYFEIELDDARERAILEGFPNWKPFPDTIDALRMLSRRHGLAIISNVDRDMFSKTLETLQTDFQYIVTAEDVGAYKPNLQVFKHALEKFRQHEHTHLHVAQSLYHDIAPANELDIPCAWINRRWNMEGHGATPQVTEGVQPDMEARDLLSFCEMLM